MTTPTEPTRRAAEKILEVAGKNEHYCPPDAVLEEIIDREFGPLLNDVREILTAAKGLNCCPSCHAFYQRGHHEDCKLIKALSLLVEDKKPTQ